MLFNPLHSSHALVTMYTPPNLCAMFPEPPLELLMQDIITSVPLLQEGKLPRPPAYIFMIDVSYGNVQSGLLHLLFNSILGVLDSLPG